MRWDTVRSWVGNEHFSCPPGILRMSGSPIVATAAGIRGVRIFEVCWMSRPSHPIFENQSSNLVVTGHSPGEVI
jgi:hypothetical protein